MQNFDVFGDMQFIKKILNVIKKKSKNLTNMGTSICDFSLMRMEFIDVYNFNVVA